MKAQLATLVLGAIAIPSVQALNIILSNDDGWASANIRAVYSQLVDAGHSVILSAPLEDESGTGDSFKIPTTANTTHTGVFGSVKAGAPSAGFNTSNNRINYLDGTPAASAIYGIDILAAIHFPSGKVDLVVTGVNYGNNAGTTFEISGTDGAAYTSLGAGVPAIAFSGSSGSPKSYTDLDGPTDPAEVYANLTAFIVSQVARGSRIIPRGVGLNVNYPSLSSSCSYPSTFEDSTILGNSDNETVVDAHVAALKNSTTRLVNGLYLPKFENSFVNYSVIAVGNASLRAESDIIKECKSSISEFVLQKIGD